MYKQSVNNKLIKHKFYEENLLFADACRCDSCGV